jgi:CBS-domain-containing membrane protein
MEACRPRKPTKEILWSGLGGFIGIGLLSVIDPFLPLFSGDNLVLVGSFGASALLVYGAFMIAGTIPPLASALAVSLSIIAMHFTCTMHPPGSATALIAVIGGNPIHALGFGYVFCPILCGAIVLLIVGLLVNNLSRNPARHYPVYWFSPDRFSNRTPS